MKFEEFCAKANVKLNLIPAKILCFDPGETTGFAIFLNGMLAKAEQLNTKDIHSATNLIQEIFQRELPNFVVIENYKVYSWKSDDHSWSDLHTSQFIGTLKTFCTIFGIPYHLQMAQQAKGFCTDDKLKEWGYYQRGLKHARDAIRHGCYYILFNLGKKSNPDYNKTP